jgi:hypothetical protein
MQRSPSRLRPHPLSLTLAFVLTALGSSACDEGEPNELDDTAAVELVVPNADEVLPASDVEAVDRQPDLVLELGGGATLGFLIDEDGVGMVEHIPESAHLASVLDDPFLRDASPAVVWHTLTKDGTEIPEPLRMHHEELAAIGEVAPLAEALTGQIRDLAPVPLADDESPCLNATFSVNHCNHPDYDADLCELNTSGSWAWNVPATDRYKAGFCLQEGEARSWLYYWPGVVSEESDCQYIRTANFVWGADSYLNDTRYAATTYFNYVWWRGANVAQRYYFHRAIGDAGSVFDFGNRYSQESCG